MKSSINRIIISIAITVLAIDMCRNWPWTKKLISYINKKLPDENDEGGE